MVGGQGVTLLLEKNDQTLRRGIKRLEGEQTHLSGMHLSNHLQWVMQRTTDALSRSADDNQDSSGDVSFPSVLKKRLV